VRAEKTATDSMRIAEVAPPWLAVPPRGYGGIEWIVSLLADGLTERGHDVTLFATGDSSSKARLEYVFDRAPGPASINSIWHDTMQTLLAFRNLQAFDVFHVHMSWAALAAGAVCGRPVVHTLHGAFSPSMRDLYGLIADRLWYVAISEAQRRRMPHLRYAGVVYNGIDVDAYPVRKDKEDFLLFLGRTPPEKGFMRALRTARRVGMRLVAAVKIAQPDELEHWNEEIEPELDGDVEVLGEISRDRKVDLLTRARALLFPIDWEEPFGLVMTEAMACGTPVIATPRGSVPEVVADGETGWIVPVEDYPERAAKAIERLDEIDPTACRERVESLFSGEAMVDGYERVFDRVLSGEAGRS
jgi:glycosyltransferase involved in cell wall biosynthesis